MINLLIAFDDQDKDLGYYFTACANHILQATENMTELTINRFPSDKCTQINIVNRITELNDTNFLFVAFSHGGIDVLESYYGTYVSQSNCHIFYNSLFYTSACSCGLELGRLLHDSGCLTFIGYTDIVNIYDSHHHLFIECENYCINTFLTRDCTILDAYNEMISYYEAVIDELVINGDIGDIIVASTLRANRDSLVFYGNETVTRQDFISQGTMM